MIVSIEQYIYRGIVVVGRYRVCMYTEDLMITLALPTDPASVWNITIALHGQTGSDCNSSSFFGLILLSLLGSSKSPRQKDRHLSRVN